MATYVQQQQFALRRTVFGDQLHRHAASRGASVAVIVLDKHGQRSTVTYAELNLLSNRLA